MKNTRLKLMMLAIGVAGLFAFTQLEVGGIKGSVTPVDAAGSVWAVAPGDTAKGNFQNGSFQINVAKAGQYRLLIQPNPPYKSVEKEVTVSEGQVADVGEIQLQPGSKK
ncbi:MAG TPA: carboxypeptidase regulatory-like domain-containing protein [Chitinophagaceae bacterium]|nr:carboxypeptidase regulatory-like domain-containing protein [Chitinophagaceae bacterium]